MSPYSNPTPYPSVTQIIGPYIDKIWFKPEDSARGTAVHGAMKSYALGAWAAPLKPDHRGYFDSGRRWFDLMVESVKLVEVRMVDAALGYCGQPDLICRLRGDDAYALVDWKTGVAKANWHPLQVTAYRMLASVDKGINTGRGMVVRLMADGSMAQMDEYKFESRYQNVFIGLLNSWRFFNI